MVALLVVGGAVALPASIPTAPRSEPAAPVAPAPVPAPGPGKARDASLAGIRVAVYNATALPALARSAGDELRSHSAHVAVFGSVPAQPGGRSIVQFRRGAEAQARRVAAVLGVARVDPYDPSTAAANAPPTARETVIVLVGYDRGPDPSRGSRG